MVRVYADPINYTKNKSVTKNYFKTFAKVYITTNKRNRNESLRETILSL